MTRQLNYKHLHYFYVTAREGSIASAAEQLHVSPQTISGQLGVFQDYLGTELFDRRGKQLVMNDMGRMVYDYAEDIFSLGAELQQNIRAKDNQEKFQFTVGVTDVIPKILAVNILESCLKARESMRLVCREGDVDTLLSELAVNKLDLLLTDRQLPPGIPIKAYNHFLGECGLTFVAGRKTARRLKPGFPQSLHRQPFLICGDKSNQKVNLRSWFESQEIMPHIVAECDDSALIKYFGQSDFGVFCTPTIIESHVTRQYGVAVIGRTDEVKERFFAISPERKVRHPGVRLLLDDARDIFGSGSEA
jgi:LysR family transcriptional activator of nhaA